MQQNDKSQTPGTRSQEQFSERERLIRETQEAGRRAQGGGSADDIETSGTDGAGTGGVGEDGGGYGPVPGSESTG